MSIGEAIKFGLLITDFQEQEELVRLDLEADTATLSLAEAFSHCFDVKRRTFYRREEHLTLEEAVHVEWIDGRDVLFDVTSGSQCTLRDALDSGVVDGRTCEYTVLATKEKHFLLDAAKKGLVAVFQASEEQLELSDVTYTLQETFENGVYVRSTNTFVEMGSTQITLAQALKIGLIDFRSAEVRDDKGGKAVNLQEAIERGLLSKKTGMYRDAKTKEEMTLIEAHERGFVVTLEREGSPFECITLWEAIERGQLDTASGMFFSVHEESKLMTLEEAVYRKYVDKKSAFVKDTWKRKYCSLSEASRKKIIKEGKIMNTTTGRYLTVKEAIEAELVVREIRFLSLIEALDFGMYQPHSGMLLMPGFEREITLREAVEFRLLDHQKTIVKNRKSNRYVSTLEALRTGLVDGNSGLYEGDMNLLEARSKGLLLPNDAMVRCTWRMRRMRRTGLTLATD
jgi:hypothetical protein